MKKAVIMLVSVALLLCGCVAEQVLIDETIALPGLGSQAYYREFERGRVIHVSFRVVGDNRAASVQWHEKEVLRRSPEAELVLGSGVNFYIMDPENYRRFEDDKSCEAVLIRQRRVSADLEWTVPRPGTWYLVFQNPHLLEATVEIHIVQG